MLPAYEQSQKQTALIRIAEEVSPDVCASEVNLYRQLMEYPVSLCNSLKLEVKGGQKVDFYL